MSSARKPVKQTIRSTDRGGIVTLSAGILCLSMGIGCLLGSIIQTNYDSLQFFKNLSAGIGGAAYPTVPALMIWLGVLLAASARRYVSFRPFVLTFLFVLCLTAFMTLVSSVAGYGSLMDYIHNINKNYRNMTEPVSMNAYISLTYRRFDMHTPPVDGGVLGMLLAFPLWRLLGIVGGIAFLVIAMVSLLFAMIRMTPVTLIYRMDMKRQEKLRSREQTDQAAQQPSQPTVAQTGVTETWHVPQEQHPAYPKSAAWAGAGNYPDPVQQPVSFDQHATVFQHPEVQAKSTQVAYVNNWPAVEASAIPAVGGDDVFIPVGKEFYKHDNWPAPVEQAWQVSTPRPTAPAQRSFVDAVDEEKQQTEMVANVPSDTADVRDAEPVPVSTQPIPAKQTMPEQPVKPVTTAPAVPLTGERVAVAAKKETLTDGERRLDGTIMPGSKKPRQLSMVLDSYEKPPLRLLSEPPESAGNDTTKEDLARADKLIQTLNSFNISAQLQQIVHGPAITRFAIRLAEGVNVNRLRNVMDNLSVELLAKSPVRAEIPIPGTPLIGIEVSNEVTTTVYLRDVLGSQKMQESKSPTAVALGKDITGAPVLCELMDMPHLLIAGATGSGKSVCINSIITSLLYNASPTAVRLILVDPKFVELQPYNDVPHLLLPVITDPKKAVSALEWVCQEMDERYKKLEAFRVRNLEAYNRKVGSDEEKMPRLVVIIDEMADLMATAGKIIDDHIKRITAKARAAGICLILATQRPSVDVITGVIKANIPSRIAFQVSSLVDSRTILDMPGAEKLLGHGDMLYHPRNLAAPLRVQGCFISDKDVNRVVEFVKSRNRAEYNVDIIEHIEQGGAEANKPGYEPDADGRDEVDELLPKAIEMAVEAGQISISMIQRVLRVGYGRAGRLIDEMDKRGIISGNEGTKPRKTLMTREEYNNTYGGELYTDSF